MNNFYRRVIGFCDERSISIYKMCKDVGISSSVMSEIKAGRRQGVSAATAEKMAKYFGVSLSYLLGYNEIGDEYSEYSLYLDAIKNREEVRQLFDMVNTASKEDVEKAVKIIQIIKT